MKRFGYSYDGVNQTFFDNATIPHETEENWSALGYPDLDFFVSLEDTKKVFLRRYERIPGKFRFIRTVQSPLIGQLFVMARSLWVPAHQAPAA